MMDQVYEIFCQSPARIIARAKYANTLCTFVSDYVVNKSEHLPKDMEAEKFKHKWTTRKLEHIDTSALNTPGERFEHLWCTSAESDASSGIAWAQGLIEEGVAEEYALGATTLEDVHIRLTGDLEGDRETAA